MSTAADDDDDLSVFRATMAGVRRKAPAQHVTLDGRRLSTRPRQQEADDREVLRELLSGPEPEPVDSGDLLLYGAPGVQDGVLRRLRRGHYRVERELDLHGHTRAAAKLEVQRFFALCHDRGLHCVRIIHGKGNGSPNSGPVLKNWLDGALRKRRDVLAFCSARRVDGGAGAVYVLLRAA